MQPPSPSHARRSWGSQTTLPGRPEHTEGRRCVFDDPAAREALPGVALRRLAKMKHVGLTERLEESVQSLAATLGARGCS